MKLWIIYKEGIGFSRIVAEMLQDRLEDYLEQNEKVRADCFPKFQLNGKYFGTFSSIIYSFESKNVDFVNFFGYFSFPNFTK